jgi:hypothetical protein
VRWCVPWHVVAWGTSIRRESARFNRSSYKDGTTAQPGRREIGDLADSARAANARPRAIDGWMWASLRDRSIELAISAQRARRAIGLPRRPDLSERPDRYHHGIGKAAAAPRPARRRRRRRRVDSGGRYKYVPRAPTPAHACARRTRRDDQPDGRTHSRRAPPRSIFSFRRHRQVSSIDPISLSP